VSIFTTTFEGAGAHERSGDGDFVFYNVRHNQVQAG
jgi:hypothetical protein